MKAKEAMLDSLLANLEEQKQPTVESDVVDEILGSLRSIRQSIELNKAVLRRKK